MLTVDLKDLKRLTQDLETAKKSALPHAVRNSLNRTAFATRQVWQREIEDEFVTRNRYTTRSIRVEKARGVKLPALVAKVGSVAPYMDTQERGGVVRGGKHKPIPTSYAAGQMGAVPRTKAVRRANSHGAIAVSKVRGLSKRQRNAIAISQARRSGRKHALLETERGKGIVRLLGRARKRGTRRRASTRGKSQVRMVYDLSRSSVRVKPTPTLGNSLKLMHWRMLKIHKDALIEQLQRHGVLGF